MADEKRCVLNYCQRTQGNGTWVNVRAGRDGSTPHPLPVCEPHWQALRSVAPTAGTEAAK